MAVTLLGKDGFYGWVNLAVMFVFYIAVMLMMAAFGVFLPFWVKEFSWSRGLIAGFTVLIFARSLPLVFSYSIILGIAFGIQSIAMGNLFPDYFGRSEFPKIMGFTMPFTTIISSLGAPLTGIIRDVTGSYIPAFQISLALLVVAFFCILFAKPPVHPSLKKGPTAAAVSIETAA